MADLLSPEQLKMYKEAFAYFDKDGDGLINMEDLGRVMRNLRMNPTEQELQDLIAELDNNNNGSIDFDEFLLLMAKKSKDTDIIERSLDAFRVFDKQNKGFIAVNDIRNILLNTGEKISANEVEELLADLEEVNGDNEAPLFKWLKESQPGILG